MTRSTAIPATFAGALLLAGAALAIGPFDPDLRSLGLVTQASATAGADLQVRVRFANRGVGGADTFMAELWLEERVLGRPPLATVRWRVRPLLPDDQEQSLPVLRVPETLAPGSYSLRAFADRFRDVAESDEGNNEFVRGIEITSPPSAAPTSPPTPAASPGAAMPDLVVERWRTPPSVAAGAPLTAAIRLTNRGQGAAGRFVSELRLERPGPVSAPIARVRWGVDGVAPGQPTQRDVVLAVPNGLAAGEYVLRVVADVDKSVAEGNEQNNVAERTLGITAPKNP